MGIIRWFYDIIKTDKYDIIEEETILYEFTKFTKNNKLQKNVKDVIDNHKELRWFENRRNTNKNNKK